MREVNGLGTPNDVRERIDEVLGEWGLISRKQFKKISESAVTAAAHNTTRIGSDANSKAVSFVDILEALSDLS